MSIIFNEECEHDYVLIGDGPVVDAYSSDHETKFVYRFYCRKCLKMRTRTRHVNRGGHEYYTEGEAK